MDRRELLKMIALLTGGAMIGGNSLLTGCSPEKRKINTLFSQQDEEFLDLVADTMLPDTAKSPGAKAAKVGSFMTVIVDDCYQEKDQKVFVEGIAKLNAASEKMHGMAFIKATAAQRLALILAMDKEAKDYQASKGSLEEIERKKDKNFTSLPSHYFTMMKQLAFFGYFTSEVGATQAMRYVAAPGRFEGSVPYKKGDKSWAWN
ncbi:gluconate 2-dehydrogenase subunit 3 family protein [Pedobacter sp. PLR]|uniref:gluconate 2-dehydrogenase subunit 3 family protein n=1 Tax=Pedobacter sp. PLR TaxID=2994465 RepID=UPI0022459B56|nr:gluconate 2-dehydrogenase subunit 3 family protein [Pedobacter sp. PLR]MCX2452446.1 gluconate 2-dehydrogenase subunit 3 family protein [Pedobacter sp. PLR]